MTSLDLIEQDRVLRAEADQLLDHHNLLDIMRRYGHPHISGSYSMRLMTWRDLDIYLAMPEVKVEPFLDLGRSLAAALSPRKASYTDHVNFPATEGISGLYWGIHTGILDEGGWKIDLWGVAPDVCTARVEYCKRMIDAMTDEMRRAALLIKNEICRHPRYRDSVTSQDVYDAVIIGGVMTIERFWSYKEGRSVRRE